MQNSEIMITNKLDTGTAFGSIIQNNQAVFIPAKITSMLDVQIGERLSAILIENTTHPEKTPWMAIRIDRLGKTQLAPQDDELAKMILADLSQSGMATVEDIANAVGYPVVSVVAKMQEMARGGMIKRRTFYAIDEADFYDGDDQ